MPVAGEFTPSHRGGEGSPMVCLHGFADTWRTWELVLPALERSHDVLALTLPGHAGGPPLGEEVSGVALTDAIEREMDEAGFESAHLVGNSLGGYISLQLAARGRASSVVAFAPAGGWASDEDEDYLRTLRRQAVMLESLKLAAPQVDALLAAENGRRRATAYTTVNFEHIPSELLAHQMLGVAACASGLPLIEHALEMGWPLDPEEITCPVRIVWGVEDQLLPWPSTATRYRDGWISQAEVVEVDGVGHCPQLDVPLEASELILGFTSPRH
ncbi:MAG: alpha/beta fold hydrolase [Solirubrobacterales bacterium]